MLLRKKLNDNDTYDKEINEKATSPNNPRSSKHFFITQLARKGRGRPTLATGFFGTYTEPPNL